MEVCASSTDPLRILLGKRTETLPALPSPTDLAARSIDLDHQRVPPLRSILPRQRHRTGRLVGAVCNRRLADIVSILPAPPRRNR